MGLLDLLFRRSIALDASEEASSAEHKASQAQRAIANLEDQMARLNLVCAALFELVHERLHITDQDLLKKLNEVDLRDGKLDGKYVKSEGVTCSSCGRISNRRHSRCIYCGEPLPLLPSV